MGATCARPRERAAPTLHRPRLVTYKNKIYIFGGTDGAFHYNNTWVFDLATRTWVELTWIGFIPVPREGHAAALVGDVMYVFGGCGVNGKDLGDLGPFEISNQRWYVFQNMGPQPSRRSGHAMAMTDGRTFVLGGESGDAAGATGQGQAQGKDDVLLVHVWIPVSLDPLFRLCPGVGSAWSWKLGTWRLKIGLLEARILLVWAS
ncbi:Negative regulator of mitotic exit [Ceratobasidium sp. UAMH 11750]|nr:Negative regulator of mitotic exit [Ceratobasidium sp. UAMH 11750]